MGWRRGSIGGFGGRIKYGACRKGASGQRCGGSIWRGNSTVADCLFFWVYGIPNSTPAILMIVLLVMARLVIRFISPILRVWLNCQEGINDQRAQVRLLREMDAKDLRAV